MNMPTAGSRVRAGVLLTLSMVVLLMLVVNHASPAQAQESATVGVSNLGQPSSDLRSTLTGDQKYAQTFCTGSDAATFDKVRIYTLSNSAEGNPMGFTPPPAPVVTIRSTDAWGKPGEVLHTLTNPFIDGSMDTAEDFTSSGYELDANTTYSVVIHRPSDTGHIAFLDTESTLEDTETQLGWAIGDQYMWTSGFGWTDAHRQGYIMKMAVYASGDLPSISTPAFTDCGETRSSYRFSVDENSPENTVVNVAAAGDADGDSLTYSVSGTDAAKFNNVFDLNASTGEITVKAGANIDYESSDKSYSITVSVTDGEDASGDAETEATIDATVSVIIDVNNVDEPGIVTLSTAAPRVGRALTATVSDPDSSVLVYTVQWARAANADAPFLDIPIDPGYMANPTYTPTAADQGKYLKVTMLYVERTCGEVSSFDDRCRREATKTLTTLVANAEGLIVQSQVVNRPATGEPRILGAPPPGYQWVGWLGIWVIRNTVRDPDGMNSGVSFQWLRVDPNTLAEENIQNATGGTYVPTRADLGRGIKVRASFVDNLGNRESRTSQPIWAPRPPNNVATGSPGIAGAVQVGQTLSADTSGISDADVIVASTFAYQWIVNDGTDDTDIQDATGATYTLGADDEGKTIKVKVSFTDEVRYEESLTSAPTATVASQDSSFTATTHDVPESHDGATEFAFELRFNEEPGSSFSYAKLRNDNAFTVTGGSVSNVRRLEPGKNVQWEITVTPSGDAAVSVSLPATTDCAAEGAICNMRNMKLSSALEFTVSGPGTSNQQSPPENSAATGTPTINGTARVGDTLTANTTGIADPDGVVNVSFTYQWLADDTEISGATGSSYTVAAADEGKVIKVTVSFTDDGGNAESLTSAATAAVALPALRLQTAAVDGATLTLTYNNDLDQGVTLPASAFTVSVAGNTRSVSSVSVSGRAVTLTLASAVASGEAVTVSYAKPDGSSFIRDTQGNRAGSFSGETVTNNTADSTDTAQRSDTSESEAQAPGAPQNLRATTGNSGELTVSWDAPTSDGGSEITGYKVQWKASSGSWDAPADVSETTVTATTHTIIGLTDGTGYDVQVRAVNAEGMGEASSQATATAVNPTPMTATTHDVPESHDGSAAFTFELRFSEAPVDSFSYTTVQEHAFTVTGGEVDNVRRLEPGKNVKWEITIQPSSNAGVTIALNATTDCSAQGAICTSDNRMLSSGLELVVSGPPSNSAATGAPTVSGTAQVGETLTAETSGIADADGLAGASFTYQWLADDTEISGATGSSYTLADSDEGKVIRVQVTFTDDAGNAESRTSAATAAVTSQPEAQAPGAPRNLRAATGNSGELAVSWDAPTSDGGSEITGYRVQWKESSGSWDTPANVSETTVTGTAHTITGLTNGTEYDVQVRAVNSEGAGETSQKATATPVNPTPLTATVHDIPESHDGSNEFAFELRFSEKPESAFSYTTLRDHAMTVTGGALDNVRRLEPGKNIRWEITVTPDSDAGVTIALNATTDCSAQGAICTDDGRKLSSSLYITVSGPGG